MMKKKNKTYFYLMFALNSRPRKKRETTPKGEGKKRIRDSRRAAEQSCALYRARTISGSSNSQNEGERSKNTEIKIWLFGGIKASLSAAWFL